MTSLTNKAGRAIKALPETTVGESNVYTNEMRARAKAAAKAMEAKRTKQKMVKLSNCGVRDITLTVAAKVWGTTGPGTTYWMKKLTRAGDIVRDRMDGRQVVYRCASSPALSTSAVSVVPETAVMRQPAINVLAPAAIRERIIAIYYQECATNMSRLNDEAERTRYLSDMRAYAPVET
jgi:hypothetical protein